MLAHQTFEPTTASVAEARRYVAGVLRALGEPAEIVELAELAVSELATNVVTHAATNYEVVIDTDGPLRIAVQDFSPRPVQTDQGTAATHGLRLLEAAGGRWGTFREGAGKQVWWEIDLRDPPRAD